MKPRHPYAIDANPMHALAQFLQRPAPAGWDAWTTGMPRWHHNFCTGTEHGTTSLDVGHHVAPGKYAGPWWPGRNVSFAAPPAPPAPVEPSVVEPVNFTRTKPGLFLMFASARRMTSCARRRGCRAVPRVLPRGP